ncbi:MAG: GspE/PulE family protein [Candidatus Brocadiia bacterium]
MGRGSASRWARLWKLLCRRSGMVALESPPPEEDDTAETTVGEEAEEASDGLMVDLDYSTMPGPSSGRLWAARLAVGAMIAVAVSLVGVGWVSVADGVGALQSRELGSAQQVPFVLTVLGGGLRILMALVILWAAAPALRLRETGRVRMMWGLGLLLVVVAVHAALVHEPHFRPLEGPPLTTAQWALNGFYACAAVAGLVYLYLSEELFNGVSETEPDAADLVDRMLREGLRVRSSDVHVEPGPEGIAVRYRIDGVLHTVATWPSHALSRIVSRIKVMAAMDIAEKRLPQDGRSSIDVGERSIDLRISTVPSNYGERAVIRILDPDTGLYGLQELGLESKMVDSLKRIIKAPHGVFFCTGPTGSGKTTTLYAALLHSVGRAGRNVITVEDPVEYLLPGVTQLSAGKKKGMSFVSALRSILRQDPDVIMVGEVRDTETAHMVIEAAQTGHLVLSTLHTNSAAGAISRLLDLDVEPFLVASSLTAVLAQRLVRRVCSHCRERYMLEKDGLESLGIMLKKRRPAYRAVGCERCMGTGYWGRTGVFELLQVNDAIRQLLRERADAVTIKKCAVAHGMMDLRMHAAKKVLQGQTTVEEVHRAVLSSLR